MKNTKAKAKPIPKNCYGCGRESFDMRVKGAYSRREFCSKDCMDTNYFMKTKKKKNDEVLSY